MTDPTSSRDWPPLIIKLVHHWQAGRISHAAFMALHEIPSPLEKFRAMASAVEDADAAEAGADLYSMLSRPAGAGARTRAVPPGPSPGPAVAPRAQG